MSVSEWTIDQNKLLLLQLKQENKELKQVGDKIIISKIFEKSNKKYIAL